MAKVKLTAIGVEKLRPPESGRIEVQDLEVPGLTLRVSCSGVKSWSLVYRFKGILRRLTLGQYPGVSLGLARERARENRATIQRGTDPIEEKKAEERDARLNGFSSCVDDFIEKYAKPHQRTWDETKRMLDRLAVPAWGTRPVKEIRRRDVVDLLDEVARDTPYQANQLRAHLSKLFNWLIEREVVEVNPVTAVAPRIKPEARTRVLSDREIAALWKASHRLGLIFGGATRFLLLTGMRREEATRLRWDEVEGTWATLPGSRMKAGRDYRAPLSASAKAILDGVPRQGEWVFSMTGKQPVQGWGHAKARLDAFMEVELKEPVSDWRIHDLRRTLASGLARLGYRTEIIKRVLAHVPQRSDVTSFVYNQHMYDAEAMEAVTAWAAHVARLVSGLEVVADQPAA